MVDFRYHLVSIIAVFLALATGIVLGTTALNGGVVHLLHRQVDGLVRDNARVRADFGLLDAKTKASEAFAKAVGPTLVHGRLTTARVAIVSLPGAPADERSAIADALGKSGATRVVDVQVTDKALDPSQASLVDDILTRVVPAGAELSKGTPVERLGSLLGAVLVRSSTQTISPGAAGSQAALVTVLAALREAGLVETGQGSLLVGKCAVVLVGPPSATPGTGGSMGELAASLSLALDAHGQGAVVAGPRDSAGDGGALTAVRKDAKAAGVSSVDDLDGPEGALTTVLALAEQITGKAGSYGTGSGASAVLPAPAA